jgi:quercetin dioxygenase-like cupin family protein
MRQRLTISALVITAILLTALNCARNVSATSANPLFKTKTLYMGTFSEIDVADQFIPPNVEQKQKGNVWLSLQKTKGLSDLYVQQNSWQPGGSTGWHTHSGHSLIIVTEGTVTGYDGHDPDCKPHVYAQGTGFVDPGGDHVHILRNEGSVMARTVSVQLIPATAARRIDVADPGNCRF